MKQSLLLLMIGVLALPSITLADMESTWKGDARVSKTNESNSDQAGTETTKSEGKMRIRLGTKLKFNDQLSLNLRWAGRYSSNQKESGFELETYNDIDYGKSTLDTLNVSYTPNKNWMLRAGRFQSKLELKGVAKKSLDRNDSPNMDIFWTDGIQLTHKGSSDWKQQIILQHNPYNPDAKYIGTSELRKPLNFEPESSRWGMYLSMENNAKSGRLIQRGISMTILPDALQVNDTERDDYIAVAGRSAMEWPLNNNGMSFILGGELGYAFNTPEKSQLNTGGKEKAGGLAGQVTFNLMNFQPNHSIGLVVAQAQGGWLLSPDFPNNTNLLEVRYGWKIYKHTKLEFRARQRTKIDTLTVTDPKHERRDTYLRLTYKF